MDILQQLRSNLTQPKPIGFGSTELIELAWVVLLALLAFAWRPWIVPLMRALARRTMWCMLFLAALPVALRALLLPNHPAPSPSLYDEFAHLLVADTLLHRRLANPMHPMHRFFETFFVLQEPTYSSIYPLGQGAFLALGRVLFGHPWAGVVLSASLFCALCYWMLLGWTTPEWALLGGLLAVAEFGPLNYWMNSYWGGAVPALAGCLVFGALPRLMPDPSQPAANDYRAGPAVLLGAGLAIHWLTRPYETIFLWFGAVLYFLPILAAIQRWREWPWKAMFRVKAIVIAAILPAIALTLLHDKRVTGRWLELPETLSMEQYGVPAALTLQTPAEPHRALTPEQQLDYKMQRGFGPPGGETVLTYLERLEYRIRFYRFFYLTPLYLALPLFFTLLRQWRFLWVALTLGAFALGINFFPAYQHHYLGAVTCLFVLASVTALQRLSEITIRGTPAGRDGARLLILACAAQFVFWYSVHVFDNEEFAMELRPYETWDAINHRNPERRLAVKQQLAQAPGRQLVFVRYDYPRHIFQDEWVYNDANIDGSQVVWARDLGAEEDEKLRQFYPGRTAWLLEPDFRPPRLGQYEPPHPPEPKRPVHAPTKMQLLPVPEAK
jgi:hypothetical protein